MTNIPHTNIWFQYWKPNPRSALRLFCFPYAGGSASLFRTWSKHLPPEIEVCPIQLPGRDNRLLEDPFPEIMPLIRALKEALHPYLDKPYALFGHSMGSLISFELVRSIRHEGIDAEPIHLFASGHRAPQLPDPASTTIHHLPEPAFVDELRRLKGTPEEVLENVELLHLLLPLLRADFALCKTYHYIEEKPLSQPISVFGGLQDSEVSRDEIIAWKMQSSNTFKARFFPGDHFFIHKEQAAVLYALAQDLATHTRVFHPTF